MFQKETRCGNIVEETSGRAGLGPLYRLKEIEWGLTMAGLSQCPGQGGMNGAGTKLAA